MSITATIIHLFTHIERTRPIPWATTEHPLQCSMGFVRYSLAVSISVFILTAEILLCTQTCNFVFCIFS